MANGVPQTRAKLSQQLMLMGFHQMDDTASPFDNLTLTNIAQTVMSFRFLAGTSRFRITQERNNYRRRGINSSIESFGVVPGTISTQVEMNRVVFQTEDAMGGFQFLSGNIAFQTRPLVLMEITIPALDDQGLPVIRSGNVHDTPLPDLQKYIGSVLAIADLARSPVYSNCWVSNGNVEYKLEGAQAVMHDVTLTVGRVSPAVAMIFPSVEATLVTNLPLVTRATELVQTVAGGTVGRIVRSAF